MKIWWLDYHPAFDTLKFVNYEDFKNFSKRFTGESLSEIWVPVAMESELRGKPSDIQYRHGGNLFIGEEAKEFFYGLDARVEFLPVQHENANYYVLNVMSTLDCIDKENCKEKRIGGRLVGYEEYAFHLSKVSDQKIFRVKQHDGDRILNEIFVTDDIRNQLVKSNLKGYQLVEVWDSEFSWQEKETKYNSMVNAVNKSLIRKFDYKKAVQLVQDRNFIAYSGKWAMKLNDDKELVIGDLQIDGTYSWMNPVFIPPILLNIEWGSTGVKRSIISKLKGAFPFKPF